MSKVFIELNHLAAQGDEEACMLLGFSAENGLFCEKDDVVAESYYRRAGEKGNNVAYYLCAKLLNRSGRVNDAVAIHKSLMSEGFYLSGYALGEMYELEDSPIYSIDAAIKWYMESAKLGFLKAAMRLGEIYEKVDIVMSIFWYKFAASKDDTSACQKLFDIYIHADEPYKCVATALQYLCKAVSLGSGEAKLILSELHIGELEEQREAEQLEDEEHLSEPVI